jgi:hypothetical protein
MTGSRRTARKWSQIALLLILGASSGCQNGAPRRITSTEPGLSDPGATVVEAAPPGGTQLTWVDRHPLFSKPREYYDNSGSNKVVKTAAATVIGIPAGIVGEIKQIVVGTTGQPRY